MNKKILFGILFGVLILGVIVLLVSQSNNFNTNLSSESLEKIRDRSSIEELRNTDTTQLSNEQTEEDLLYQSYDSKTREFLVEDKDYNSVIKLRLTSPYVVSGLIASSDTKVAEFLLIDWKSGKDNLIDGTSFHNVNDDYKQVSRTFKFKWANEITNCVPTENTNGTIEVCNTYTEWVAFNFLNELPHKSIRVGLFTQTNPGERIEWIPTIGGFEVLQFAEWDISTATIGGNYSVAGQEGLPAGLHVKPDGSAWFMSGFIGDDLNEYSMTDGIINTSSPVRTQSLSVINPSGIHFNTAGTNLISSSSASKNVSQFTLDVWDITTLTITGSTVLDDASMVDLENVQIFADGYKLIGCDSPANFVIYNLSVQNDITSKISPALRWDGVTEGGQTSCRGFHLNDDGDRFYYTGSTDKVDQFTLSTPNLFTTTTYIQSLTVNPPMTNPYEMDFNAAGTVMYLLDIDLDRVVQYHIEPAPPVATDISVTLTSPLNNSFSSSVEIEFNATYAPIGLNLTNATYYVWNSTGVFNKTTVTLTVASNSSLLNISGFRLGTYLWNVHACGINATDTICNFSKNGNFTFDWRPFEIISQTYSGEVYETAREKFELNITTIPDVLSVSVKLVYNGTSHSATTSCVSGECNIIKSIDIPLVNASKSQNKTFFFNLTFYDGTNSFNFDTEDNIRSQNVSRIRLEVCNATYKTETFNFTAYDEINLTNIRDFKFGATFSTWLGKGTIKRSQSFDKSPVNETTLCLFPNQTHYTDATIDYDTYKVNSTAYVKRQYYFQNDSFTNVVREISLYLLKAEDSTSFIQVVQDQKLSPVIGALIITQRFYPSDGIYRIVQISKTDDNGESIGFYEAEIPEYKHLIKLRGLTLFETALQKVVGKSVPYTLTFTIGDALTIPWSPWEENPNIVTSLVYNDTSKLVTFSYIDSTEETAFAHLVILQEYANNNSIATICNETSIQSSATIVCNMTDFEGTFVAKGVIGSERSVVNVLQFVINTALAVLGNTGLIIGVFIILTAGMAFIWNPVAGIVGINAAMWFVSMIGFISFPPIFLFAILGVSIITIILLKT